MAVGKTITLLKMASLLTDSMIKLRLWATAIHTMAVNKAITLLKMASLITGATIKLRLLATAINSAQNQVRNWRDSKPQ